MVRYPSCMIGGINYHMIMVLVSPCLPFLRLDTIEGFYNHFKTIDKNGLLGVIERKTYYWDENKKLITKKFEKSEKNMNTKVVETTYEAIVYMVVR